MATRKKPKKELLRQRAERLLSEKPQIASKVEDEDIKRLAHELQVHQIELEMQNEELRRAQAEIEESRTKYSDLYDFAPVGYFTFRQTGEIVEVNLTGASLLGVDRSLLLHRSFSAYVDPGFRSLFRNHRLSVLGTEKRDRCELKLIRKHGNSFYASIESISVPHEKSFRIRSAVSDITELKKAQEKAETEHAFRIAVENSVLSGIAAVDLEGQKFYVNLGFCRMLGRTEEELVGRKPPFSYWPPEELDRINKAFSTMMNGKAPHEGFQLRFMRKNEERFDVLLMASPLKDPHEKVMGWIATIGDITHLKQMESELKQLNTQLEDRVRQRTAELENANEQLRQKIIERKRAEEVLHEERDRFSALIDSIRDEVWFADAAGQFTLVNPPGSREFHLDADATTDVRQLAASLEVFRPDGTQRPIGEAPPLRALSGEVVTKEEELIRTPATGELRYRQVSAAPVRDGSGNIIGSVSVVRDITERRQLEEELRRSRDELEMHVQERTAELAKVNEKLMTEIAARKQTEGALIEQSRVLEGFFTSTITPLVFLDRNFNFLRVNEAYANACQRDISEFPGHNHFEFYPHEENEALFKQVVETKLPYQAFAKPFSFPDHPELGVTYWDWTLTPLLDDKGEVEFLVFSLEDVTEHKRAEDAFRKEYNFRKAIENSVVAGVAVTDLSGKLIYVNNAFRKMVGWSEDELVGMVPPFIFWPPESAKIAEEIQQNLARRKSVEGFELRLRRRNKERFDTLISISPLSDTKGETTGWVASFLDITERKRAEEALKAAQQYNRSLIEASPDPLVTISADGKVMDVNEATKLVTGMTREGLIGSDFSDYFTDPARAKEGYQQVFTEGLVRDYPLAIRHTSGKVVNVLYNATVYRNEAGEIQGVFAAARDITELTEAHRRMEATNSLLNLFVRKSTRKEYLDSVIELIQPWSGCRCVGIRILNEKDYIPYESHVGFDQEFWESENLLSVKYDQCACIRVVTGRPDPQDRPVMTPVGSFRCENTFEFIESLLEEEKTRFRGICIKNGFKSVAIVPIRYRDRILGAIHLADESEGKVTVGRIEFIESMTPMIGEAINRFNLEEELKDSEGRLRHLSSQLLTVQENERKRIAVELHDSIGQMLTAIKFKIESILQEKNKKKSLETLVPLVRETIEETRRIQMDLRPSTLDDIGVLATLDWFCREYQKIYSHIRIEKEIGLQENEVSVPLKTVIYRLTQEALNNIAKHSKANLVHLSLQTIKDRIELIIKDNGIGFGLEEILSSEKPKKGLGLNSMRERAELSGGTFVMESAPGAGTTIRASWPI
jgi:PAS domain S-box-containing protein